ncbi:MAG TPA: IS110 family transposase, partial [Terracidiphilus sp.]|nr:IS110 family transposase [Terracidiphilus sp.]
MSQTKRPRKSRDFSTVNPAAAAIDIGATIHVAAVGPNRDKELVRTFRTFTDDLCRLADWFAECGVRTVVMESTGVYWMPVFEILEQRGFEVMVVNARDAKHVPGRKTDVSDAQWLQRLHEYGLLRASFRPQAEIAGLRAYLRQRERLLDYAAAHIQHMQKAMMQMNLQLHHVVAGVTGMAIIRAIVAGERDPNVLAAHRDRRCHASVETVCQALVGNYREEHVFALTQALELYDVYQTKVNACDKQIEAILKRLKKNAAQPAGKLLPIRQRTRQPNAPAFDARAALHAILGVDLTQISGLGPSLALKLVGECGTNLAAWPSAKHFTSWLALAPHNK